MSRPGFPGGQAVPRHGLPRPRKASRRELREGAAHHHGIANARVSYTPAGGKFEIGCSVENLADKHYAAMGFDNTGINGLAQRYPGMPRWFKAHVNYKF